MLLHNGEKMKNEKFEYRKKCLLVHYDDEIKYLQVNDPYRDLADMRKARKIILQATNDEELDRGLQVYNLLNT